MLFYYDAHVTSGREGCGGRRVRAF
jgi:hypothetical protein